MTKEFRCNYKSQDFVYGKGIRLFNSCGDNKGKITAEKEIKS